MAEIFDLSGMPGLDGRTDHDHETSLIELQHGISILTVVDDAGLPFLKAVPALLQQRFMRELIIVDKGCPKELLECLQKISQELPVVQVVAHKHQHSYSEAINLAAKKASGKYLMVVDQHAVLPKNATLRMLMEGLAHADEPWLISALIENPELKQNPLSSLLNPKDATLALLGKKTKPSAPSASALTLSHQLSINPGCFLLPRKQFWANGGFDTACYNQSGIMDLCLKVHLQGGNVFQADDVNVSVYPSSRHHASNEFKSVLGWVHYYRKHYQKSATKSWLLPLSILLLGRALVKTCSKVLSLKRKKKRVEPSIAELLKRQTLS